MHLRKIPGIIAQYEERTAKLKADVPQLEAIVAKQWGKEEELRGLKSELAALDRKITAALAPKKEEQDGEENKQQSNTLRVEVRDNQSQTNGSKESLVAEPKTSYSPDSPSQSRFVASARPFQPSKQSSSFRSGPKF